MSKERGEKAGREPELLYAKLMSVRRRDSYANQITCLQGQKDAVGLYNDDTDCLSDIEARRECGSRCYEKSVAEKGIWSQIFGDRKKPDSPSPPHNQHNHHSVPLDGDWEFLDGHTSENISDDWEAALEDENNSDSKQEPDEEAFLQVTVRDLLVAYLSTPFHK